MKNRVTIHMGASCWDVFVRDAAGNPVHFDLYHMNRDQRGRFFKEFKRAYKNA